MNPSTESLYGPPDAPLETQDKNTPGLLDQIVGVFTSPRELFEKMRPHPKWVGALLLMAFLTMAMSLLWAFRADFEVLIRETLERQGQTLPGSLETIAAMQKKFAIFGSVAFILIGVPIVTAASAGVLMLLSRSASEGPAPTFRQCLAADVVPSLVKLPQVILMVAAIGLRDVGGSKPDALMPTALNFWVHPESVKLAALLNWVDPFALAYGLVYALSLRHLLKMKWAAIVPTVLIWSLIKLGFALLFAR